MTNFNHLSLVGLQITDTEYAEQHDLPISIAGTPDINNNVIAESDDPASEESRIEFLYALNGLREEANRIREMSDDTQS